MNLSGNSARPLIIRFYRHHWERQGDWIPYMYTAKPSELRTWRTCRMEKRGNISGIRQDLATSSAIKMLISALRKKTSTNLQLELKNEISFQKWNVALLGTTINSVHFCGENAITNTWYTPIMFFISFISVIFCRWRILDIYHNSIYHVI